MRVLAKVLVTGALIVGGGSMTGCLAVLGAGGTGAAYAFGDVERTYEATPEEVIAAAKQAMDDLGWVTLSSHATDASGRLEGRAQDFDGSGEEKVVVKVKSLTSKASEMQVRIGTIGDDDYNNLLVSKIDEHLGARTATPR